MARGSDASASAAVLASDRLRRMERCIKKNPKIKKDIYKLINDEKDMIKRRYTLYIDDLEQLNNKRDVYIWMNNNSYLFSKYAADDIKNIFNKLK